jgi:hypothetical protein
MRNIKILSAVALILCGMLFSAMASAEVSAESDTSFWWIINEENENGIRQSISDDEAVQDASGFALRRARVSLSASLPQYNLYSKAKVELADSVRLLDAWVSYRPYPLLNLYAGQMKIPSTYEVQSEEFNLDFITKTTFSSKVTNYSLSTAPYDSPLVGMNSYSRDVGIGVKGAWKANQSRDVLRYFVMVSNGLGANESIGKNENSGLMTSNKFGDYFYGTRAEVLPFDWMTIGGHYNYNKHDDMLYRDKASVIDLNRTSWSTDVQVRLPWDFRVAGLYGEGAVNDNWLDNDKKDYEYTGWEVKVMKGFFKNKLELGVRLDSFGYESNESGVTSYEDHWTYGINYNPIPEVRLQLNYIVKESVIKYEDDPDDNIVFLNMEMLLDSSKLADAVK